MLPRTFTATEPLLPRERFDPTRLLPILIVAAGFGAYSGSFGGVFVFDDLVHIVQNDRIRHLWPLSDLLSGRRPMVDLTLAVNYRVGALNALGSYHAVNLTVHILAALTLYGIVRRTLLSDGVSRRFTRSAPWLALTTALIWVVHPLLSQSVTYLIQRAESLMGLFYLLTVYCLIRGVGSSRRVPWYSVAVVSCALGMASKAVIVTAPVVVLLYDRAFLSSSFSSVFRKHWGLYIGLAATWGVLWWCGVAKGVLNPSAGSATVGFGLKEITPLAYALTQPGVVLRYLALSAWPHPLCLDYSWPVSRALGTALLPTAVFVVLLVALAWYCRKRYSVGFVAASFFIVLAPTSSFIPIRDVLFEHRMYLSLASVIVLFVVGGHMLWLNMFARLRVTAGVRRLMAASLVGAIVTSLGWSTMRRNEDYKSAVSMWEDVVAKRPHNARAFEQLGTALVMQGKKREAADKYRSAVEIDPDFASARANLANALFETGSVEEAAHHYQEVLRVQPNHIEACVNLGHALDVLGRPEESIEAYSAATRIDLKHTTKQILARAYYNLGSAMARQSELDEAISAYREALRLWPDYEKANYSLGRVLFVTGSVDEAIRYYDRTLKINKNNTDAQRAIDEAIARKN